MPTNDSPKRTQLTQEQEAKLAQVRKELEATWRSTAPINIDEAVPILREIYTDSRLDPGFEVLYCASPLECEMRRETMRREEVTFEDDEDEGEDKDEPGFINEPDDELLVQTALRDVFGEPMDPFWERFGRLAKVAHLILPCRGVALFSARPVKVDGDVFHYADGHIAMYEPKEALPDANE